MLPGNDRFSSFSAMGAVPDVAAVVVAVVTVLVAADVATAAPVITGFGTEASDEDVDSAVRHSVDLLFVLLLSALMAPKTSPMPLNWSHVAYVAELCDGEREREAAMLRGGVE